MPTQTFAILLTSDISALGKRKASGCAVLLYSALLSYSRNKVSAFPSIATLSKVIGGVYSDAGIYKALKWLEQHKFIKRNDKRSKQRFVMLRKMLKTASTKVETVLSSTKVEQNRKKEKYSFFKKQYKQKRKSFTKKNQAAVVQNPVKAAKFKSEEDVWSDFVYHTNGKDLTKLSSDKLAIMGAFLRNPHPEAVSWREIMWPVWGDTFLAIKDLTS